MMTMQTLQTLVEPVLKRAANTFWQAASATAVTLFLASGISLDQLTTKPGLQRLYSAVLVGAFAAGLSAVKTLAVGFWLAHKSEIALKVYTASDQAVKATMATTPHVAPSTLTNKALEAALQALLGVLASEGGTATAVSPAPAHEPDSKPWQITG